MIAYEKKLEAWTIQGPMMISRLKMAFFHKFIGNKKKFHGI